MHSKRKKLRSKKELVHWLEAFDYNPRTGKFTWAYSNRAHEAGEPAGTVAKGYIRLTLYINRRRRCMFAHDLAWIISGRELLPGQFLDHIDGNPQNNRLKNLRIADNVTNSYNRRKPRNNTSGVKGVSWNIHSGKWFAQVSVNRVRYQLGSFERLEDAAEVVAAFRRKHHGQFARSE